ncbi:MAG: DNA repair protein [Paracoccaceae bacterium]|nr:MAG: DNA repair protein [Paracoccaceae bacterium]
MQSAAQALLVIAALAALGATAAAALGFLPWPEMSLRWGGVYVPQAGMWLQVGLTALLLMLCLWLPANARMARLEAGHRSFVLSVEDVRRAYEIAHAADRRSVFALSSEFDSLRQRMEHLRRHPDLADLEPELLTIAAQMSHQSRDLARVYSADRVERARTFLRQRQEETARMAERLSLARSICDELRRWLTDIEAEERKNHTQVKRLEADLRELLPMLGYELDDPRDANVVPLGLPPAMASAARRD